MTFSSRTWPFWHFFTYFAQVRHFLILIRKKNLTSNCIFYSLTLGVIHRFFVQFLSCSVDYEPRTLLSKPSCGDGDTVCKDFTVTSTLTSERTQYWCKFVTISESDVSMIGFEPIQENSDGFFHHAILYGCSSPPPQSYLERIFNLSIFLININIKF